MGCHFTSESDWICNLSAHDRMEKERKERKNSAVYLECDAQIETDGQADRQREIALA